MSVVAKKIAGVFDNSTGLSVIPSRANGRDPVQFAQEREDDVVELAEFDFLPEEMQEAMTRRAFGYARAQELARMDDDEKLTVNRSRFRRRGRVDPDPRRVVQRLHNDCFFCCVAMMAGMTYKQLGTACGWELYGQVAQDASTEELHVHVLKAAGFVEGKHFHRVWTAPAYIGPSFVREMLWGRKAIVQTPLGQSTSHAVYWTGEKLLDPNPSKSWGRWENIYGIDNVWLFTEE